MEKYDSIVLETIIFLVILIVTGYRGLIYLLKGDKKYKWLRKTDIICLGIFIALMATFLTIGFYNDFIK